MEDPILYNVCNTCGAVEHHDTEGIVSVYENLANKWFCSSYCLYTFGDKTLRRHLEIDTPSSFEAVSRQFQKAFEALLKKN